MLQGPAVPTRSLLGSVLQLGQLHGISALALQTCWYLVSGTEPLQSAVAAFWHIAVVIFALADDNSRILSCYWPTAAAGTDTAVISMPADACRLLLGSQTL